MSPAQKRDRAWCEARRGEASALIVYLSPYLVLVSLHCRLECIMSDWTGQARGGNGT